VASFSLFEELYLNFKIPYSKPATGRGDIQRKSGEAEFFPNLPQTTPYPQREKAIDAFLGEPILEVKKEHKVFGKVVARTTLKKYHWVGETEVFSIESEKWGPTTLVFSPHFNESETRRYFHWLKDIPLQSGRLILLPEANRTLALQGGDPVPMNRIFNEALAGDRIDYLVVRRTQYLMGLVDGMIGLHTWGKPPGFISDIIMAPAGEDKAPQGSPWVNAKAKKLSAIAREIDPENSQDVSPDEVKTFGVGSPPQVQWRVAEVAARKLKEITERDFIFTTSPLLSQASHRADNSTAYMNLFLGKPAMTFEGGGGRRNGGRLLATAAYSLMVGYGHWIHPSFETALKDSIPEIEPELYEGLPPQPPASKTETETELTEAELFDTP
jgi:hypothetical protein